MIEKTNTQYLFAAVLLLAWLMCSCGGSGELEEQRRINDSLRNANIQISTRYDKMEEYLTVISSGLDSISLEEQSVLMNVGDDEGRQLNRQQMKDRLDHVRDVLSRQRDRIRDLEGKLSATEGSDKRLLSILTAVRQQLEQKDAELSQLRRDLSDSRRSVAELQSNLQNTVAQLNSVQEQSEQIIQSQQATIDAARQKLGSAYVKIDNKKALEKAGLLKGGFLKKKKVDYSNIDSSVFDRIDIYSTTSFALPKKYKILSPVVEGSYTVTDNAAGGHTLTITNPESFWSVSNYLIIQTD